MYNLEDFISNIELIVLLLISFLSFLGMAFMIKRKIKSVEFAYSGKEFSIERILSNESLNIEKAIQKLLISLRIIILKADTTTFKAVQKVRERVKKKMIKDKYWEELKKIKKE